MSELKFNIQIPERKPTLHTMRFTEDEVKEALFKYLIKRNVTIPEGNDNWIIPHYYRYEVRDALIEYLIDQGIELPSGQRTYINLGEFRSSYLNEGRDDSFMELVIES